MSDINLQEIHDTLVEVAFEAGRMILAANPNNIDKGSKMNCTCASPNLPSPSPAVTYSLLTLSLI